MPNIAIREVNSMLEINYKEKIVSKIILTTIFNKKRGYGKTLSTNNNNGNASRV